MISAKVIKQSRHWKTGKLITTFEIVMHRFVLPEKNTHKMLSKNSASSLLPQLRLLEKPACRARRAHAGLRRPALPVVRFAQCAFLHHSRFRRPVHADGPDH